MGHCREMRFSQAFSGTVGIRTICPDRVGLLTGPYPHCPENGNRETKKASGDWLRGPEENGKRSRRWRRPIGVAVVVRCLTNEVTTESTERRQSHTEALATRG